jgi:hypothetical protein
LTSFSDIVISAGEDFYFQNKEKAKISEKKEENVERQYSHVSSSQENVKDAFGSNYQIPFG